MAVRMKAWFAKGCCMAMGVACICSAGSAGDLTVAGRDGAAIQRAIDARCGVGCYSPLFNPLTYKPHKAYYAFVAFNELKKLGATVATSGDGGKVWSLAAAKDGRVAVMVANFGDTDVPFGLDLGCVPSECILTDETRTAEKVAVPEALPRHSFLLVQGRR